MMLIQKIPSNIRHYQIAKAALDIVAAEGFKALNIKKLSQKVGLVPSGLYRHFQNKDQIVQSILQLVEYRLAENFRHAAEGSSDAIEFLFEILHRHIRLIEDNAAFSAIFFSEELLGDDPEVQKSLKRLITGYLEKVERVIRNGQAAGCIREDLPAETLSIMFLGLVQPAVIVRRISGAEFDAAHHILNAWRIYREMIRNTGRMS